MKSGARALGLATSYAPGAALATVAGVVVRADRVVDGFVFGELTVGGSDSTATLTTLVDRLERPDVQYVFIAGIAPAQYNILALSAFAEHVGRPTLAIAFEESNGLESAIRSARDGHQRTMALERYRSLPERWPLEVNDGHLFIRAVGVDRDEATRIVREFTPTGTRPEPLRVARQAARAVNAQPRNKTL